MSITEHDTGDLGGGRPGSGSGGPSYPSAAFENEGDYFDIVLVDRDEEYPRIDYYTKERKLTPKGKPATLTYLVGVLMQGSGRFRLGEGQRGQLPAGSVVSMYIEGHNRWDNTRDDSWSDVVEAFVAANGNVAVGDVVRAHVRELLSYVGRGGVQLREAKRVVAFSIRRPTAAEAGWVTMAAEARRTHLAAKAGAQAASSAPPPPHQPPPAPVAAPPAYAAPSAPPAAPVAPPAPASPSDTAPAPAPPAPAPAPAGPPPF